MSDRWFIPLGLLLAVALAVGGVYAWGLVLGWWSR